MLESTLADEKINDSREICFLGDYSTNTNVLNQETVFGCLPKTSPDEMKNQEQIKSVPTEGLILQECGQSRFAMDRKPRELIDSLRYHCGFIRSPQVMFQAWDGNAIYPDGIEGSSVDVVKMLSKCDPYDQSQCLQKIFDLKLFAPLINSQTNYVTNGIWTNVRFRNSERENLETEIFEPVIDNNRITRIAFLSFQSVMEYSEDSEEDTEDEDEKTAGDEFVPWNRSTKLIEKMFTNLKLPELDKGSTCYVELGHEEDLTTKKQYLVFNFRGPGETFVTADEINCKNIREILATCDVVVIEGEFASLRKGNFKLKTDEGGEIMNELYKICNGGILLAGSIVRRNIKTREVKYDRDTNRAWLKSSNIDNLAKQFKRFITEQSFERGNVRRRSLRGVFNIPECPIEKRIAEIHQNLNGKSFRESLIVEHLFEEEKEISRQRKAAPARDHKRLELQISKKKEQQEANLSQNQDVPILKLFTEILSQETRTERMLGLQKFSRAIEKTIKTSDRWFTYEEGRRSLQKKLKLSRDDDEMKELYGNIEEFERKNKLEGFAMVHLWRELCVTFLHGRNDATYPKLASQHLLDGGVIELMNGDAGTSPRSWVREIMNDLQSKLKQKHGTDPRILVISVLGEQSVGKSTFLKTMFGCPFKASLGACTRGINMSLVPSKEWASDFQYILLLDTEGLCNPLYKQKLWYRLHNNTLAALSVLSADFCVMLQKQESQNELEEVLPMVMQVWKESSDSLSQLRDMLPRFFVVFNRMSSAEMESTAKLQDNINKFKQLMVDCRRQVFMKKNREQTGFYINDFMSAGNTVEPAIYSRSIFNIRCALNEASKLGKKRSINEWWCLMSQVIHSVDEMDFALSFRTIALLKLELELNKQKIDLEALLVGKWGEIFEMQKRTLERGDSETQTQYQEKLNSFKMNEQAFCTQKINAMKAAMQVVEDQTKKKLNLYIEKDEFKSQTLFDAKKTQMKWDQNIARIRDVFQEKFEKVFQYIVRTAGDKEQMEQRLLEECRQLVREGQKPTNRHFNEIWEEVIREAKQREIRSSSISQKMGQLYEIWVKAGFRFKEWGLQFKPINLDDEKELKRFVDDFERVLNEIKEKIFRSISNSKLQQIISWAKGVKEEVRKLCGKILNCVNKMVTDISVDCQDSILDVIRMATEILDAKIDHEWKQKLIAHLHHETNRLYRAVYEDLEQKYSVVGHLHRQKGFLKTRWDAIAENLNRDQRMVKEFTHMLARQLIVKTYTDMLDEMNQGLSDESWATNWSVLWAEMSLYIALTVEKGNVIEGIRLLNSPRELGEKVLSNLFNGYREKFLNSTPKKLLDIKKKLYDSLKTDSDEVCLLSLAIGIKRSRENRHKQRTLFKRDAKRCFGWLREHVDTENDCMLEWKSVVDGDEKDGSENQWDIIVEKLSENVESMEVHCEKEGLPFIKFEGKKFKSHLIWPPTLATIRKIVKSGLIGQNVKSRCLQKCPRCAAPCYRHTGHTEKHDCYHQHQGLSGTRYTKTGVLIEKDCAARVKQCQDQGVKYMGVWKGKDLVFFPYTEFPKHYNTWQLPTQTAKGFAGGESLNCVNGVMAIIWNKKQQELATFHKCKASQLTVHTPYNQMREVISDIRAYLNNC